MALALLPNDTSLGERCQGGIASGPCKETEFRSQVPAPANSAVNPLPSYISVPDVTSSQQQATKGENHINLTLFVTAIAPPFIPNGVMGVLHNRGIWLNLQKLPSSR